MVAVRIFFAALLLGSVALLRPSARVVLPLLLATTSIVSLSFANADLEGPRPGAAGTRVGVELMGHFSSALGQSSR